MTNYAPPETKDTSILRFRTTQLAVDYLTAFALWDKTTIGVQVRAAIDGFLNTPTEGEFIDPIESRKLIRQVETAVPPDVIDRIGAVATNYCASVDQTLLTAFDRYTTARLDTLVLEEALEHMVDGSEPS